MLREPSNERQCAYADGREWRPWAGYSFGTPERIYFPNDLPRSGSAKPRTPLQDRLDLARLRSLVVDAERRDKQVHVVGSGWSYSNVAFTSGYLVSTQAPGRHGAGLDQVLPLDELHISEEVRRSAVFAHGGCHVSALVDHLDAPGSRRTLITVGGTAGDTLAGVISTGVHGSQPHQTPLSDSVLGLLIIAEEGKLHWIQRKGGPVARGDVPFDGFDGEVVSDDEVMDAAVLSLGCFGIIYAVLVRTEPLYWLAETCRDRPLEGDFRWLSPGDELGTALADPENDYVEVVMNPHAKSSGAHTARLATRSLVSRQARLLNLRSVRENARLLATFGSAQLRNILGRPSFVSRMAGSIDQAIDVIRPIRSGRPLGRCHDFMGRELPPLRMAACEVAFPRARTPEMIDAIVAWTRHAREGRVPFVLPGAVALRYTKPSRATLSMHGERMERAGGGAHDTAAEIIAVQAVHGADRTRGQLLDCVDELVELGGIPHWGLLHRASPKRTLEMYGEAKLASWRRAYRRLNPTRDTFENDYARDAGLCG
jgi:hypothetical protein